MDAPRRPADAMAFDADLLPPRYTDAARIGTGAMGDIYRATDSVLERVVAVKLLAERYAEDGSFRERFTREALTAARLGGEPGIVTIFDVGEWNGRPFIVMEYLPGGSLEDRLRRGVPDEREALEWLEQAAVALDAGHRHGVVHRDVKPGNLLLDGSGAVHVADFGIARAAGLASLTVTGTILGTPGYLSPEQATGGRATPASDRYALAVVAWELLTGERPFASDSPTAEAAAHVNAPVPSLCDRRRDLPCPELDRVFARALAKDPGARYGSCGAFVGALREALAADAAPTRVLAPPPPPPPRARRRAPVGGRWLVPAAVAAALLVGGVLVAAVVPGDDEPERSNGRTPPGVSVQTVTMTEPGTTVETEVTVTEPAAEPEPAPAEPAPAEPSAGGSIAEGIQLTDEATALLQQERYEEAAEAARRALEHLGGTGELYEAYALYDLGASLIALGNCEEGLPAIDRSEEIQGHRSEFDRARAACGVEAD